MALDQVKNKSCNVFLLTYSKLFTSGTETIKRGASPPIDATISANQSIEKLLNDQVTSISVKKFQDEKNTPESSSSGPNSSSVKSYKPAFSASSALNNYKHYSSIMRSSGDQREEMLKASEIGEIDPTSRKKDKTTNEQLDYSLSTLSSSASKPLPTKTVSVKTNGDSSTTVTNNFKLPPFPVYVPSTSLTSTIAEQSLNKKVETVETTAFSSKFVDAKAISSSTTSSRSQTSSSLTTSNVSNTSSLPLHIGKNNPNVYQSETNFNSSMNVTSTSSKAKSSPSTDFSSPITSSYLSNQKNYNNVYSPLPKNESSTSYISKYDSNGDNGKSSGYSSHKYSNEYYSTLASTNGSSTFTSSATDNNVYRVQYSATNPFLDLVDPPAPTEGLDNISSLLRGSVSETKKKFEKLDSEEDLK